MVMGDEPRVGGVYGSSQRETLIRTESSSSPQRRRSMAKACENANREGRGSREIYDSPSFLLHSFLGIFYPPASVYRRACMYMHRAFTLQAESRVREGRREGCWVVSMRIGIDFSSDLVVWNCLSWDDLAGRRVCVS